VFRVTRRVKWTLCGTQQNFREQKSYCTQNHFDLLVKMIKFPARAQNTLLEMETASLRNVVHFYISHAFHFGSGRSQTNNCTALHYVNVTEFRSSVCAIDCNYKQNLIRRLTANDNHNTHKSSTLQFFICFR